MAQYFVGDVIECKWTSRDGSWVVGCDADVKLVVLVVCADRPFGGDVKSGKIDKIDVKTGGHVSITHTVYC